MRANLRILARKCKCRNGIVTRSSSRIASLELPKYQWLEVEADEPIAVVKMTSPWFSVELGAELQEFCRISSELVPGRLRAIVLTGSGPNFSTGHDLERIAQADAHAMQAYREMSMKSILGIYHSAIPVIAAIEGKAIGWGFELALAADLAVASPASVFRFAASSILGFSPTAAYIMRNKGITSVARKLLFTDAEISGDVAKGHLIDE